MSEKKRSTGKQPKIETLKRKSVRVSVARMVKGGAEPITELKKPKYTIG